MKKWISCILAIALLLIPATSFATNFSFGLKDSRGDTDTPADEPAVRFSVGDPADVDIADDVDDVVTPPAPAGEMDLSSLSDDELEALVDAVLEERYARMSPAYGKSIEDGLMLIDQDGLRLAVFESSYLEDSDHMLRFDVLVENNTGVSIGISIVDPTADGQKVEGIGIYNVLDGTTVPEYFYFEPADAANDPGHLLDNARSLSFAFGVWEYGSYEDMFEVPITLNAQ